MKVLISAFEPFGGESINPSSLILEKIPNRLGELDIIKILLPVCFYDSSQYLASAIDAHKPDFVISLGQAGGRSAITIEKIGINLNEAPIPDNNQQQPRNESINAEHADGYFTTLPIQEMVAACHKISVPCQISYSAGTYVCNHVMFSSLAYIKTHDLNCKSGFIHIPYLPEQVIDKPNQPSMCLESMVAGIEAMIYSLQEEPTTEITAISAGYTH